MGTVVCSPITNIFDMRHLSPVVWSEGMHLSPHHFQAQNRYFEDSIYFASSALWFASYGVVKCELDDEAIQNGRVSIRHARGILPDGLPFSMPEPDALVEPLNIRPLMSEIEDNITVYFGAPAYRTDTANCASEPDQDVRYTAEKMVLHDENTGRDEKEVKLGRKNFRLYTDNQVPPGYVGFPIARVRRESSRFVYDASFVPPCLHIMNSKRLVNLLDQLIIKLEEKGATLARQPQAAQSTRGGFSTGEVSAFWVLNTINSNLPTFRHLSKLGKVHPEELFRALLRLAGSLCTFVPDSNPSSLPLYDHDRLAERFDALEKHIHVHLDKIFPPNDCVPIPLRIYANFFHAGVIQNPRCFGPSKWILSIRSPIAEADLISLVPKLVKICSALHIERLAASAISGLTLSHLPAPPATVARKVENQYFSISKEGRCWDYIVSTKQIGVYVPQQIPKAEAEILVVL
jgi:type VI secretion system protein ImpJ